MAQIAKNPQIIRTRKGEYMRVSLAALRRAFDKGFRPGRGSMIGKNYAFLDEDDTFGYIEATDIPASSISYRRGNIDPTRYVIIPRTKRDLNKWTNLQTRLKKIRPGWRVQDLDGEWFRVVKKGGKGHWYVIDRRDNILLMPQTEIAKVVSMRGRKPKSRPRGFFN